MNNSNKKTRKELINELGELYQAYNSLKEKYLHEIGITSQIEGAQNSQNSDKLKESQLLLKSSIESLKDIIFLAINKQYQYLFFNAFHKTTMLEAYGSNVEAGMNLIECISNESDRIKARINYDRALNGESHTTIEEYGDKIKYYYETIYNPIVDENEQIIGATAYSSNITNRINSEKALKESEERFTLSIDASEHGIWDWDLITNAVFFSKQWKKQIGYEDHEINNDFSTWIEHLHPKEKDACLNAVQEYVKNPCDHFILEFRFRHKDGSYRWIHNKASSVKNKEGKVIRMFGAHTDITERKEYEEALRESKENLAITLQSIGDGVISTDKNGLVVNMNPIAEKLCGWTLSEASGKPLSEVFTIVNSDTREIAPDPVRRVLQSKEIVGLANHTVLISRDGNEYQISDSAAPIKNDSGKISGVVLVFSDVTEKYIYEKSLRKSERMLLDSQAVAHIGSYITDLRATDFDTTTWQASPEIYKIFGIDENYPHTLASWAGFIHPDFREELVAYHKQVVEERKNFNYEYKIVRINDQGERWVHGTGELEYDEQGIPIRMYGAIQDITERKLAEAELQKIEWLLKPRDFQQESFEPVYGDITSLNTDGVILKALGEENLKNIVNDFMNLLETSSAVYEKNGDYAMGIFSSGWCQFMDNASFKCCKTNDVKTALYSGKWHCHESCWNQASKKAIETGNPVDIECNGGIHLYAVPIRTDDEIIGAINFGYGNPPQDTEKLKGLALKYQVNADELVKLSKEYNTRPQYIIDLAKNRLEGAAKLIALIVQRNMAEQELIKAKEKAEESDRLKSAFLANMSHEIRTPMNGILGFAELLKEPGLTGEKQHNYINIIEKSGVRMLNIINNIIDISKIEAGLMKTEIKESDVNEQIDDVYTFFKPEVEKGGVQLSVHKGLAANDSIIATDREKLYAILINLVKNASKYTKTGSIEFGYMPDFKSSENSEDFSKLKFFVKDTGIGIAKDRQRAIFERFIQADIEDKMAIQGAGLGLAITKSYIEMLGGEIWVESEEGKGSVFYFTLPYNSQTVKLAHEKYKIPKEEPVYDISIRKVLIVEDDETSYQYISTVLGKISKSILHADTGTKAIEICRSNKDIDLILMDIKLPDKNGYEATQMIRQFNSEVIIISQTAFGLSGDRELSVKAGCNDYIAKPINREALLNLIRKYFRKT